MTTGGCSQGKTILRSSHSLLTSRCLSWCLSAWSQNSCSQAIRLLHCRALLCRRKSLGQDGGGESPRDRITTTGSVGTKNTQHTHLFGVRWFFVVFSKKRETGWVWCLDATCKHAKHDEHDETCTVLYINLDIVSMTILSYSLNFILCIVFSTEQPHLRVYWGSFSFCRVWTITRSAELRPERSRRSRRTAVVPVFLD